MQKFVPADAGAEVVIRRLEDDLQHTRDHLRLTLEQQENSLEELKASNEELQAINEELRSTSEELETSAEELQSVNEELTTVNQELKDKVDELSRTNFDLNNLMVSTDIGTIFLDRVLHIKRYTLPIQRLFNIIPADIGRPLAHLTHRLEYTNLVPDAEQVLRTLQPLEREIISADGHCHILRITPYRTAHERVEGVLLTFVDISERKRDEEELLALSRRVARQARVFDTTLSTLSDYVFNFDRDGRVLYANQPLLDLWGRTAEDTIGKTLSDLDFPPDLEAQLRQEIERVFESGNSVRNEGPYTSPLNYNGYFEYVMNPVVADDGTVELVVGSSHDISERRRAGDALRNSEERLRLLVESATDFAIFTITAEEHIESWSEGAERLFGYAESEILGQPFSTIFTPEDRAAGTPARELQTAQEKGRASDDRWHLRKDGSRFYASGAVSPIIGISPLKFVKIARDLTERKKMEEALREAGQRKDEFLATLAHELRNPLAPIRSGLEIIRRPGCSPQVLQETLTIIARQTGQIVHLVDDLLDISRITQGKIKLHKEHLELKTAIDMALETSQAIIDAAQHELSIELPDAPIYLDADLTRIAQILLNLLNNAAKYTAPGGKIRLKAEVQEAKAVISILDTGLGISPEMLSKIFDMFTQIETTEEQARAGLGIGLSVVKKLVEMHGGTVAAFSDGVGRGSEFVVRLPLAASQAAATVKPPPKEAENGLNQKAKSLRVLVVDDNQDAAEMLEILLQMEGHEVRIEFDGATALATAAEFQPAACVLDIGLPDMDGYELARHLRTAMPQVLLIALSGWGQDEDRRRSRAAGFNHHLVKPVEASELEKLLGGQL